MKVPDNFGFFLPLEIAKSTDDSGEVVMKISGVASTNHIDADDEMLDPRGFDLSYFMDNGFFNYNHQAKNDPSSIVGEPTKAWINERGELEVEGILYDTIKGREIYALGQALANSKSSKRQLGYSIEGKVLERDLMDTRKVRRAKITGCAITPSPKNGNTFLNILKGEYNEEACVNQLHLADGTIVGVDNQYNLFKVEKSIAATGSGSVLSPESVDGSLKNEEDVKSKKKTKLVKSETSDIFMNENIAADLITKCSDAQSVVNVYQLAQKISNDRSNSN